MENNGMIEMFKSLEESGLKGFLGASDLNYEEAVIEFFTNAKVIEGTIVKETVTEMRSQFSGCDEPFRAPNKKKGMKIEFRLLHDVVAKALCAKAGSFDQVTSAKLDMMIAISAGLKVNRAPVLFRVLLNMARSKTVPADSLSQLDFDSRPQEGTKKLYGQSKATKTMGLQITKPAMRKQTTSMAKKKQAESVKEVATLSTVEARDLTAPMISKSETSSKIDSCPLVTHRRRRPHVEEPSESEETTSAPSLAIVKKRRTMRTRPSQIRPHLGLVSSNPMENADLLLTEIPEETPAHTIAMEDKMDHGSPHTEHINMAHQNPQSSAMPIVVYTTESRYHDHRIPSKIPEPPPTLQILDPISQALISLIDRVSSLDQTCSRMKIDTDVTRHHLHYSETSSKMLSMDWKSKSMFSRVLCLESWLTATKTFDVLETTMVRHYADSHQQLADELVVMKSQLAELVEHFKQIGNDKKGERGQSRPGKD
ncbi:hypothetical protein F511_24032 [Dorcoceras hygrometricum]|uniref:Uncharacterized protein n=1 Tax=Dorcoceras hygrometricum TaxID=472368 RepID=A0A2Z7D286_9LAMI|nr:hypothetical protein F511_24032 [Dorcoceras hygrometricum]